MKEFKDIENRFIKNLANFNFDNRDEAIANFSTLWNDIGSYSKHIRKRMRNRDIESEFEYLMNSFEVLSSSCEAYIETYPKENLDIWDRVFYNKQKSWAVVVGENGKILTSYKIRDDIIFDTKFMIPNAVIKQLYFDYFKVEIEKRADIKFSDRAIKSNDIKDLESLQSYLIVSDGREVKSFLVKTQI
ncbi:hypothetical protein MNB_SV-12-1964 [hydrothermal vent metagenome]|uniref:Uncharacterized protein n=1 Tax=hydrothermal vent metagenome TaxID=652676 RepID=A0A1W1CIJ6_9ZZZZ